MTSNHKVIEAACEAVGRGALLDAKKIIAARYPFVPMRKAERQYTDSEKTRVFMRDGFIDRYSGERLVFPPVLRILSYQMPAEFPFHKNWKMSKCHFAYWQLLPTLDHIIPVCRDGEDIESNWVCTSQLRNSAKAHWLLSELGWELHERGDVSEWDGMMTWFVSYVDTQPELLEDDYLRSWNRAARRVIGAS